MARRRRRNLHRTISLPGLALVFALVFLGAFAFANTISGVNPPPLGGASAPITANSLKPSQCSSIDLSNVTRGSGGGGNDLILGSGRKDTLHGNGGDDCIVGGGGGDSLYGDAGSNDICVGGNGKDKFPANNGCETIIP